MLPLSGFGKQELQEQAYFWAQILARFDFPIDFVLNKFHSHNYNEFDVLIRFCRSLGGNNAIRVTRLAT